MREQMVTRKSENALNVDTQKLRVLSFEWACWEPWLACFGVLASLDMRRRDRRAQW